MPSRSTHHHLAPTRRKAFTLIELLVVIAIISLLIGILVPGLAGARESARLTRCASNMRQAGILMTAYEMDYKGFYPRVRDPAYGFVSPAFAPSQQLERTWVDLFSDLGLLSRPGDDGPIPAELICPSARGYENDPTWSGYMPHIGYNTFISPAPNQEASFGQRSFAGRPLITAEKPASKILLTDARHIDQPRGWHAFGNADWVDLRHAGGHGGNVLYLDQSLKFIRPPYENPVSRTDPNHPFAQINIARIVTP